MTNGCKMTGLKQQMFILSALLEAGCLKSRCHRAMLSLMSPGRNSFLLFLAASNLGHSSIWSCIIQPLPQSCVCVCVYISIFLCRNLHLFSTRHWIWAHLFQYDLILIWLHLPRSHFQVWLHSWVLDYMHGYAHSSYDLNIIFFVRHSLAQCIPSSDSFPEHNFFVYLMKPPYFNIPQNLDSCHDWLKVQNIWIWSTQKITNLIT